MLGINIGKNKDTALWKMPLKIMFLALSTLHPFADFLTLNISSPNTEDLRNLQEKDALRALLDSVCAHVVTNWTRIIYGKHPITGKTVLRIWMKTALENCIRVIQEFSIQGVIVD